MLVIFNVALIKYHYLFSCKSHRSFMMYMFLYVDRFSKMLFSLIELSRIVFSGIFVTLCLKLTPLLSKQTKLKQKKSANKENAKIGKKLTLPFIFCSTLC